MTVINAGVSINDFLGVPGDIVTIIPPSPTISPVPTNVLAIVGTGIGGAVNSPTRGSFQDLLTLFGAPQATTFDAMTQAYIANIQGANDFIIIRVTDGTDVAATALLLDTAPATGLTLTALHTGTLSNTLKATLSAGTNSLPGTLTYKLTVFYTGQVPEIFDNVGGSGATFWTNLTNAVNLGQSGVRGPSNLVLATVGAGTAAPTLTTYTLAGGTNGNSSVTSATLIGTDGLTRTGMYAMRDTVASLALIADLTDTTKWSAVEAFAKQTFIYFAVPGAIGQQDSVSTAISNLQGTGVDNPNLVAMLGDWIYYYNQFTNTTPLGSLAAFRSGLLATLQPWESVINKPIVGIIATQKSRENRHYSSADKAALRDGRLDVIGSPSAGGAYFSALLGCNTSSNQLSRLDNYPRMNAYLGRTIDLLLGGFISDLFKVSVLDDITCTLFGFLQPLKVAQNITDYGIFALPPNAPNTNNPQSQLDLGIVHVAVNVQLAAIIINILCNLDANQGVTTTISTTQTGA